MFDIFSRFLSPEFREKDLFKIINFNFKVYYTIGTQNNWHLQELTEKRVEKEYTTLFYRAVEAQIKSNLARFRRSFWKNRLRATANRRARLSIAYQRLVQDLEHFFNMCAEVTRLTPHQVARLHHNLVDTYRCGSDPEYYIQEITRVS